MVRRRKNPKYTGGIADQIQAATKKLGSQTAKKAMSLATRFAKKYPHELDRYYLYFEILESIRAYLNDEQK